MWVKHDESLREDCTGKWSSWSACSQTCGQTGRHTRRYIITTHARYGGLPCKFNSSSVLHFPCNRQSCPTASPTSAPTAFPTFWPTTSTPTSTPTSYPTAAPTNKEFTRIWVDWTRLKKDLNRNTVVFSGC